MFSGTSFQTIAVLPTGGISELLGGYLGHLVLPNEIKRCTSRCLNLVVFMLLWDLKKPYCEKRVLTSLISLDRKQRTFINLISIVYEVHGGGEIAQNWQPT